MAGVAALLLVISLDWSVLGRDGPWRTLGSHISEVGTVYAGTARDRVLLQKLGEVPPSRQRLVVMGTSRANRGFRSDMASMLLPPVEIVKLTHAMMDPFAIRSLAPEVAARGADLVVLLLSEFDTHRPLRIEPIPDKTSADLGAMWDVMWDGGLAFSLRNRETFYRIMASWVANSYRFRELVGRAGLNTLREFEIGERLAPPTVPVLRGSAALGNPSPNLLPPRLNRAILGRLQPRFLDKTVPLAWFLEIKSGEHARVQMRTVRRTALLLRDAGAQVVIVECPLHEVARVLAGRGSREEFVAFAGDLAQEERDIHFLSLDGMAPFDEADFSDLLHLNRAGARKLTREILLAIDKLLKVTARSALKNPGDVGVVQWAASPGGAPEPGQPH